MDRALCSDLVQHAKSMLDSIQHITEQSRAKFADREYGEDYYKSMSGHIEKIDLLLDGFINFMNSTTPAAKKITVNTQIDEVLKKHQIRLEEKQFRIFRKFDRVISESIVPHEQMVFVLNTILKYAEASISSGGIVEIETRALGGEQAAAAGQSFKNGNNRYAEIIFTLTDRYMRLPGDDESLDLLLRLVLSVVERNQGTMAFESDKAKSKKSVFLVLPADRRKV
jgi:hypothetical protein